MNGSRRSPPAASRRAGPNPAPSTTTGTSLHYDWYLDEATGAARLVEAYASVEAVLAQVRDPVFTEVGAEPLETCTFVHMDAFGDTGELSEGTRLWPSTCWGTPFARTTG